MHQYNFHTSPSVMITANKTNKLKPFQCGLNIVRCSSNLKKNQPRWSSRITSVSSYKLVCSRLNYVLIWIPMQNKYWRHQRSKWTIMVSIELTFLTRMENLSNGQKKSHTPKECVATLLRPFFQRVDHLQEILKWLKRLQSIIEEFLFHNSGQGLLTWFKILRPNLRWQRNMIFIWVVKIRKKLSQKSSQSSNKATWDLTWIKIKRATINFMKTKYTASDS